MKLKQALKAAAAVVAVAYVGVVGYVHFTQESEAQTPGSVYSVGGASRLSPATGTGGTNALGTSWTIYGVGASATNTLTAGNVIDCTKASQVGLGLAIDGATAGFTNGAVTSTFDRSIDGSTWVTGAIVIGMDANGTTEVVVQTNITTTGAIGYLRLASVVSAAQADTTGTYSGVVYLRKTVGP